MTNETLFFLFVLAGCAFLLWEQRRQRDREVALLRDQLEAEREENSEIMDRWYQSKGLPPAGTDMKGRHERREQDAERRREAPRQPAGPVAAAHRGLAEEERRQNGQS